jgi:hypothetical protein
MYQCKRHFTDDNNVEHKYGKLITLAEYDKLTSQQQRSYAKIEKAEKSVRALVAAY